MKLWRPRDGISPAAVFSLSGFVRGRDPIPKLSLEDTVIASYSLSVTETQNSHCQTSAKSTEHQGDVNSLLPVVYDELRQLARRHLQDQKPGQTLQATALVHEVYLKLSSDPDRHWNSRRHFLSYASEAMRRILIDQARKKLAAKRGAGAQATEMVESRIEAPHPAVELLEVNDALDALAETDAEAAELAKLRYFAGFTMAEAAKAMGMSVRATERLWTFARASLKYQMSGASGENSRSKD